LEFLNNKPTPVPFNRQLGRLLVRTRTAWNWFKVSKDHLDGIEKTLKILATLTAAVAAVWGYITVNRNSTLRAQSGSTAPQNAPSTPQTIIVIVTNAQAAPTNQVSVQPGLRKLQTFADIRIDSRIRFLSTSPAFLTSTFKQLGGYERSAWDVHTNETYIVLQKDFAGSFLRRWPWLKLQPQPPMAKTPAWFPWGNTTFETYEVTGE
jgi:hypothetical protein